MLLQDFVIVKWNAKNIKYYTELGYTYTKNGKEFEVKIEDATPYNKSEVWAMCDYCGEKYKTILSTIKNGRKYINKDCCSNPTCTGKKAEEVLEFKYGVKSCRHIEGVNDKIIKTTLEKYGVENPFQSEEIKEKIKNTCLEKYGCEHAVQSREVQEKIKNTCLDRYGVPCYLNKDFSGENMRGSNSPVWKGGISKLQNERSGYEYINWRKAVFERDHFVCQCCGKAHRYLNAHHIYNWRDYEDLRYNLENGITLCEECHVKFHSMFGKRYNNQDQLDIFFNLDE